MSPAEVKEHAHSLIDLMTPVQREQAIDVLEDILDGVSLTQADVPFQEKIGKKEEQSVAGAEGETEPGTSFEELLAEFGFTMDDWERAEESPNGTE